MAGDIFISYRRDDSAGTTGRIYDRLVRAFPREKVFMDVDAAMHGLDFVRVLNHKLAACDVVAVVIGPRWLDAADSSGQRRLDNPHDFIRIEVGAALKRGIPVIPVLVDDAELPDEMALPPDLKGLSRRHAVEIRNTRFNSDAELLVEAMSQRLGFINRNKKWLWGAAAACLALVAVGVVTLHSLTTTPGDATAKTDNDNKSRDLSEQTDRSPPAEQPRQASEQPTQSPPVPPQPQAAPAVPDLASLPICDRLWYQRNAVFHNFGYCFSSTKGQTVLETTIALAMKIRLGKQWMMVVGCSSSRRGSRSAQIHVPLVSASACVFETSIRPRTRDAVSGIECQIGAV
jgi:TIR domain/YARHG domain